jgi:hypothetical protein
MRKKTHTFILSSSAFTISESTFQSGLCCCHRANVKFKLKELINSSTVEVASESERKIALEESME